MKRILKDNSGREIGWEEVSDAPPETHIKVMDAQRFLLLLTREELVGLHKSTDPLIQNTVVLFQMRNGEVNVESQIFADVVAAAVADGSLTQARADELSEGIPL